MPLPLHLNTNEVKDKTGTEVEMLHWSNEGRVHIYHMSGEKPSEPAVLKVQHQESGTGFDAVRRSNARVDKSFVGKSGKVAVASAYKVVVVPIGELDTLDVVKDVSAMLDSFCATTGAATAVLFDGSGTGDSALIYGTT